MPYFQILHYRPICLVLLYNIFLTSLLYFEKKSLRLLYNFIACWIANGRKYFLSLQNGQNMISVAIFFLYYNFNFIHFKKYKFVFDDIVHSDKKNYKGRCHWRAKRPSGLDGHLSPISLILTCLRVPCLRMHFQLFWSINLNQRLLWLLPYFFVWCLKNIHS